MTGVDFATQKAMQDATEQFFDGQQQGFRAASAYLGRAQDAIAGKTAMLASIESGEPTIFGTTSIDQGDGALRTAAANARAIADLLDAAADAGTVAALAAVEIPVLVAPGD